MAGFEGPLNNTSDFSVTGTMHGDKRHKSMNEKAREDEKTCPLSGVRSLSGQKIDKSP